jgi:hypothetical protein
LANPVLAQTVGVSSLSDFSTENPPKTISVKLIEPLEVSETEVLDSGVVLKGDLADVVSPKRLKRDADFSFYPKSYIDKQGKSHIIKSNIKASYTVPMDKGQVAKKTVLSVGNHFVSGLSMGVAAVEGAIKNEDGNRFKSSVNSAYQSSPLSLTNKGDDIYITKDMIFFLKFPSGKKIQSLTNELNSKQENEVQGQNYSYTIEKE